MKKTRKIFIFFGFLILLIGIASCSILTSLIGEDTYDVTFENYDLGTKPNVIEDVTELPNTLPELSEEGYQFGGWYYDEKFILKANPNDELVKDETLYAKWERLSFTLLFENNGHGKSVLSINNIYKIPELEELEEEGYRFGGWYYDREFNEPAKKDDLIFKDTTLYAKWENESFNVRFENNGHGESVREILGVTNLGRLPVLEEEGYQFGGWYYDIDFAREARDNEEISNNVILYAKWEEKKYSVYFDYQLSTDLNKTIMVGMNDIIVMADIIENKGYDFIEWNTKRDGTGNAYLPNQTVNESFLEDVILYAIWERKEFTVTFVPNNGEENIINKLYYGDDIVPTENPTKTKHKFVYWEYENEPFDFENEKMPLKNIILTAKYLKEVEILFIANGMVHKRLVGYETEQIKEEITEPDINGYQFGGWYYNDLIEPFNALNFPTKNLNIYAKLDPVNYNIFFDNGQTIESINTYYNQDVYAIGCDLINEGYVFDGWNTSEDGNGETYKVNENLKNISTKDITLYAVWKKAEYTLTIQLNNGEADIIRKLNYNDNIIPIDNPTKEGAEFVKWLTYENNQIIDFSFDNAKMPNRDMTIFAKYLGEVMLLFMVDTTTHQTITGLENEIINEVIKTPNKEGYQFGGWFLDKNYQTEYNLTTFPSEDINIYSKWEANTTTIIFNGNGETSGTMPNQEIVFDSQTPLNKNQYIKTGYEFIGWTKDSLSDVIYNDQYSGNVITEGETTLYAVWKAIEYNLTIILNNGEADVIQTYKYDEPIEIGEEPTKEGYLFKGWYLENNEVFDSDNATMPAYNLIIHAEYYSEIVISFIVDGEVVDKLKGYEQQEIFGEIVIPSKTGYKFLGWFLDEEFEEEFEINFYPSENIYVYAKLEPNVITIIFDGNDQTSGTMPNQEIVFGSQTPLNKNQYTKTGYEFIGWSIFKETETPLYTDQFNGDVVPEGEIILYAVWKKISYNVYFVINSHGTQPNTLYNVNELPDELPILIEEGFIFVGWYYDEEFQNQAQNNDIIDKNVTLYAKWEIENIQPTETIVDSVIYDDFQVHFLELGNDYTGDSTYIKAGDLDILIDAGSRQGSAETIKKYVDKYCLDNTLEYVIVTHADQDHIAGFVGNSSGSTKTGIFYQYDVEVIIDFPKSNKTTQIYNNYKIARDYAISNGACHYTAAECFNETNGAQSVYQLTDEITMTILYNYYYFNNSSDENNFSVCTLFTYNDHNFLFTGDLEESGEEKLAQYYDGSTPEKTLPQVDLFKAGHHGSKTSSNDCLLSIIQPEIVCVCCCAGGSEYTPKYENTFPTQEMINRVAKYTDRIYVTSVYDEKALERKSLNGNIIISSNGRQIGVNATNNVIKLKDSSWFNEIIYVDSSGNCCSGTGKKDYYTSATPGTRAVPRRVWPV